MSVKRGLGRGFDSLIPTELLDESFDPTASQDDKISDLRTIKIAEIHANEEQPRTIFDKESLDELAASIKIHGVIQPIVVTPRRSGGYTIVAGERRYRASLQAKLDKIPALVRTLTDQHKLELSLIENLQRKNLNVLETATAYLKLRDQFNLTMEQIGKRVGGKSASTINNTIRILQLPDRVKELLSVGALTEGQARPLINLDPEIIKQMVPRIVNESWSARRIEQTIAALRRADEMEKKKPLKKEKKPTYTSELKRLQQRFALPVKIKSTQKGSGTIEIAFGNEKELQQLIDSIEK